MIKKKNKRRKTSNQSKVRQVVAFPAKVLEPVRAFLTREEKRLVKRGEELKQEDPFTDVRRVEDSAAPDTDAAEQSGHERISAIRRAVERKHIQVKKALTRIKLGKYGICEHCGKMIDTDRLMIMPEATLCVKCEREREE